MPHPVPSASVSMCQMRSARSLGAYSSIPSGCSSTCPSESTKSSGAVAVIGTPRVRAELNVTLEEPLRSWSDVFEHTPQVGDHNGALRLEVRGRGRIRPVAVAEEVERRHPHGPRAGDIGAPSVAHEPARG